MVKSAKVNDIVSLCGHASLCVCVCVLNTQDKRVGTDKAYCADTCTDMRSVQRGKDRGGNGSAHLHTHHTTQITCATP